MDGISLTVNAVQGNLFRLTIVPHTAQETTIARWKPGHRVNLEVDQIARYLERLMQGKAQESSASTLTLEKLAQSGFL
ncbi:Riboflavin synthase [compost metagenome]